VLGFISRAREWAELCAFVIFMSWSTWRISGSLAMSALWACCEVAVTWYAREEETCSLVEKLHSSRCKVTKRVRWLWWAFMVCDPCLGFASLCGKLNTMVESILATGNKVYIVSSPMVCTSWPDLFYHPAFKFLHCMHVSYFYAPSRSLRWRRARGVMAGIAIESIPVLAMLF